MGSNNSRSMKIEFDNHEQKYIPGAMVCGYIVLDLDDNVKASAVIVELRGSETTKWKEYKKNASGNGWPSNTKRYKDTVLVENQDLPAWLPTKEERVLQKGRHRIPFRFRLGSTCPPTFETVHGKIGYKVHCTIVRPWKTDISCEEVISVNQILDISKMPLREVKMSKEFITGAEANGRHGVIKVKAVLLKEAYVSGEKVVVDCIVYNNTTRPIIGVTARLISVVRCSAKTWNSDKKHTKDQRETLSEINKVGEYAAGTNFGVNFDLSIPETRSSFCGRLVILCYAVEVCVEVQGFGKNDTSLELPLVIGTLPFESQFVSIQETAKSVLHQTPEGSCADDVNKLGIAEVEKAEAKKDDNPKKNSPTFDSGLVTKTSGEPDDENELIRAKAPEGAEDGKMENIQVPSEKIQ